MSTLRFLKLKSDRSGKPYLYDYSEALVARGDMVECDAKGKEVTETEVIDVPPAPSVIPAAPAAGASLDQSSGTTDNADPGTAEPAPPEAAAAAVKASKKPRAARKSTESKG